MCRFGMLVLAGAAALALGACNKPSAQDKLAYEACLEAARAAVSAATPQDRASAWRATNRVLLMMILIVSARAEIRLSPSAR